MSHHILKSVLLSLLLTVSPLCARFGEAPFALTIEGETLSNEDDSTNALSTQARLSIPLSIKNNGVSALSASYEHSYFSSDSWLPFDSLQSGQLSLISIGQLHPKWKYLALSNLRFATSGEVAPLDALTLSGIYGTWYSKWDSLLLGGGVIVSTRLSESTRVLPLILLDWEFRRHCFLTTAPTPGTRFGPGLSLAYRPPKRPSNLYFGVRYVSSQYQLATSLYEYRAIRLLLTLEYKLNKNLTLNLTGGMGLARSIQFEETEIELDSTPFAGLDLSWNF